MAARPERGRANKELLKALSKALGIPRSQIAIVSGHTSRHKVVALAASALVPLQRLLDLLADE